MPLDVQIHCNVGAKDAGLVTIKLVGSLDSTTAPDLEWLLAPVLAGSVKDMVFDLGALRFIGSAGLRVFVATRKALEERGGQASFVNLQPQLQEVFSVIKALPGISIFRNAAELDRYLAARQRGA